MKHLTLIFTMLICAGLMFTSCQKGGDLAPEDSFSQSEDFQNPVQKFNPNPAALPSDDPITNYPDPFTETTTIQFTVPADLMVKLIVYNEFGEEIQVLYQGHLSPGVYMKEFGSDCPCGKYRAVLQMGDWATVEEMTKVDHPFNSLKGDE